MTARAFWEVIDCAGKTHAIVFGMQWRIVLQAVTGILLLCAPAFSQITAAERQALLNRHNYWRRQYGLPDLTWSTTLASYAQAWANRQDSFGELTHSSDGKCLHPAGCPEYGENLFWQSAVMWSDGRRDVDSVSGEKVVDDWVSEKQWYDANANRCSAPAGESCGHFTQVVWRTTMQVGCGKAIAKDKGQYWVCNYAPAGNIVGERPFGAARRPAPPPPASPPRRGR